DLAVFFARFPYFNLVSQFFYSQIIRCAFGFNKSFVCRYFVFPDTAVESSTVKTIFLYFRKALNCYAAKCIDRLLCLRNHNKQSALAKSARKRTSGDAVKNRTQKCVTVLAAVVGNISKLMKSSGNDQFRIQP